MKVPLQRWDLGDWLSVLNVRKGPVNAVRRISCSALDACDGKPRHVTDYLSIVF